MEKWPSCKRIRSGFVNFDEIGAFLHLLANDGHDFRGIVSVGGVREDVLLGIVMNSIFMAAENVDGIAADPQARARDCAMVDGIADGRVGGASTLSAPMSRSAVKPAIRSSRAASNVDDCPLRDGIHLQTVCRCLRAGMQEEVYVNVD